jgi:putative molybdopterin biosynthesis protein
MFRKLLSLEEAKNVLHQKLKTEPLGVEETPLLEAYNRVLSEDMVAAFDVPPFNRSTVDGYAVKAEDTFGAEENNPTSLKVCGTVNVGEPPKTKVTQGTAAEIVTGAPIPEGADAVVMVEDTVRKDYEVRLYDAVAKDENIMKAGADIKKGETVLGTGQLLSSREIGVLAALGVTKVNVYTAPSVAVLSTGAEIVEPSGELLQGKIYDINAYTLSAAVLESGGNPLYLGVFPDDMKALQQALRHALASADTVITSGGVSVGPTDVMPQTLNSLGKPGVIICGVAIKPGKPTTIALIDGKPVFSLPGNPTSSLLVFHLLASPAISCMAGRKAEKESRVKAIAATRMFSARGRRTFVMVKLKRDNSDRLVAEPVPTGLSGAITTLAKAEGFIEIAENQQFADAGEEVTVHLLKTHA